MGVNLHRLGYTRRELPSPLYLRQHFFSSTLLFQWNGQQVGRRNRVLNRQIYADSSRR